MSIRTPALRSARARAVSSRLSPASTLAFAVALGLPVVSVGRAAAPPDEEALRQQIAAAFEARTRVPDEVKSRYRDFAMSPTSGIIRLIPAVDVYEGLVRGGGAYYSFRRHTHQYGQGSDIQLQGGSFHTGLAGADYGYLLRLPDVPIEDLAVAKDTPPNWLPTGHHAAWAHLWTYAPPRGMKTIREHQRAARGLAIGEITLTQTVPVVAGSGYLLRSIEIDRGDALIGFQVVETSSDGSVTIVWKILKVFDVPTSKGPDNAA